MVKKDVLIIADYSQNTPLTVNELCEVCQLSLESVYEFIAYEIIQPAGSNPQEWVFDITELQRVKKALRLQQDLEINLAGIAVVLSLLEELEHLRAHTAMLEKHLLK